MDADSYSAETKIVRYIDKGKTFPMYSFARSINFLKLPALSQEGTL